MERARRAPRVQVGQAGARYYVGACDHCEAPEAYQHLEPASRRPVAPVSGAVWSELAWCEDCGTVEATRLVCLPDGSVRAVMG